MAKGDFGGGTLRPGNPLIILGKGYTPLAASSTKPLTSGEDHQQSLRFAGRRAIAGFSESPGICATDHIVRAVSSVG
jgi:hypothetical protein